MNSRKIVHLSLASLIAGLSVFTMQNCSKVEFSDLPQVEESLSTVLLEDRKALVYGSDVQDRKLLAEKVAGYAAPAFSEVFANWRRISGGTIYTKVSDIDVSKEANSYCYTKILATGLWEQTLSPVTNKNISPSTDGACVNSAWFSALSWSLTSDGRLAHATNSGNFNGFISGVKFDNYISQAVVTSAHTDDDEIALIMAVAVDSAGNVHSLSASRSQGGYTSDMGVTGSSRNWRIAYRVNNILTKTYGEQAIDVVNKNKGSSADGKGEGDVRGWDNRSAVLRIEREANIFRAYTSNWGTSTSSASSLPIVSASKIELDVSEYDELSIFKGSQYVGYGMQSQPLSQIFDMSFSTRSDAQFIYDLQNDWVYEQQSNGTYRRRTDLVASEVLGYPRKIANVETQKEYLLKAAKDFEPVK